MTLRQEKLKAELSGKIGSVASAQRKSGYSESYIDSGHIKKTKSFQQYVHSLYKIRDNIVAELERRNKLTAEEIKDLADVLEKINKQLQLISDDPTEIISFKGWTPIQKKTFTETGKRPDGR